MATHCGHTNGVSDFALWRWAGSNSKNSSSLPPASPDDVRFFIVNGLPGGELLLLTKAFSIVAFVPEGAGDANF